MKKKRIPYTVNDQGQNIKDLYNIYKSKYEKRKRQKQVAGQLSPVISCKVYRKAIIKLFVEILKNHGVYRQIYVKDDYCNNLSFWYATWGSTYHCNVSLYIRYRAEKYKFDYDGTTRSLDFVHTHKKYYKGKKRDDVFMELLKYLPAELSEFFTTL